MQGNKSIFDSDLESQFDIADVVAALQRIEKAIVQSNLTLAFGVGVVMYLAYESSKR